MASTVTLAEVRRWDPQGLDAGARALVTARDGLEELRSRLRTARPDVTQWQGVAAEQARAAHDARDRQLQVMAGRLGEVVPVFTAAADATGELLEELRYWDGVAAETGYTITRDGGVTDTGARGDGAAARSAAEQEGRDSAGVEIRAGLGRLLERAAQIDASVVSVLQDGLAAPGSGPARPTSAVPDLARGPGPVHGFSRGDFILPLPTAFPDRPPTAAAAESADLPAHPGAASSGAPAAAPIPPASVLGSGPGEALTSAWARSDTAAAAAFDPAGRAGDAAHREVAALEAWASGGHGPGTVVVQPPDPRTGTHDSLWRIADRELGDGARWPEIFALNRGDPQPGGRRFEQPGLIFPGEHLRLPTTAHPPTAHPTTGEPDGADGGEGGSPPSRPPAIPDAEPGASGPGPSSPSSTSDPSPESGPPSSSAPHPPTPAPPTTSAAPSSPGIPTTPSLPTPSMPPMPPTGGVSAPSPAPDATPWPGVFTGAEVFVGAGLAVAVVAGLLWARRGGGTGRAAGSPAGSPASPPGRDRDTAAAGSGTRPGPGPGADSGVGGGGRDGSLLGAGRDPQAARASADPLTRPARRADPTTTPVRGPSGVTAPAPRWSTRLPVGVRDGREIAFDLATVSGLGIDGAGAAAAVRGVTVNAVGVNLVTGTPDAPPPLTVLISREDVADLLDQQPLPADVPVGLQVLDTFQDVLDLAEATIQARTTGGADDPMPGSTLVLVTAQPPGPLTARLQAVLVTGQACGVVGVVWGDWRGGACVDAGGDGVVWATDRGPGDGLRGVRLYGLAAAELPGLLALLNSVEHGTPPPAATVSAAPPHTAPVPVETTVRARPTADTSGATGDATTTVAPPPPPDRESRVDTATVRRTPVDHGDGGGRSWTAEDIAARISAALDPQTPPPPAAPDPALTDRVAPVAAAAVPVVASPDAPDDAPDDSAQAPDQPTPELTPGPAADPDTAAVSDPANLHPAHNADSAATPDSSTGDGELLINPCPITLRILGRPALLVERRPTAHEQPQHPDYPAGEDGVGGPGAVEVIATLSARMRDLLVYLAVHPDGVRRDTAVAELWPDTGRHRPGNNLSSLISRLRAAVRAALAPTTTGSTSPAGPDGSAADGVGPIVLVEGDRYRLDDTHIAVDYWSFLTDAAVATAAGATAAGATPPSPTPRSVADDGVPERWQRAHGLYRGPLAEGVDHAWILSVREATRRTYLTVTARLVRHHVATDPAAALAILETVRNLEPTNQGIYRDIVALQLRLGDNDAAAATLRLLENQLVDVEESLDDATQALARTILE